MTTMMNTDNAVLEFGDPQFQVQSQALCPSHLLRPAHHLLIWRRTRQVGFEYFKFAIPKNGFGFTDNFRFATVKYDHTGKNLWNPCMHLCNYSINKYHSGFSACTYSLAVFVLQLIMIFWSYKKGDSDHFSHRLHQEQWSWPRWPGHFLREIV